MVVAGVCRGSAALVLSADHLHLGQHFLSSHSALDDSHIIDDVYCVEGHASVDQVSLVLGAQVHHI